MWFIKVYVLICLDFVEPCTFGVWRDIHHFCSYSQLWARLLNRGNCLMLKRKIKHDPSSFQCNSLTDIICDVFSYRFGKFWWRNTLITHTVAKFSERTSSTLVWVESGAKVPAELRVRMQRIRSYQLMSKLLINVIVVVLWQVFKLKDQFTFSERKEYAVD